MSDHIERDDLIWFVAHDVGTVEAVVDAFLDEMTYFQAKPINVPLRI